LNFANKFAAGGAGHSSIDHFDLGPLQHPAGSLAFTVPDAHLLFSGHYERHGKDLIISDQAHRVVVPNYFHGDKRPLLVSPDGAQLDSAFVGALTGHAEYAQAGGNPAAKLVGHVAKMTGSASIVRNGVAIDVQVGDTIYQSDVVQTGSRSTLGLVLSDGTAFNLSANARLMLNDLTFDANSTSNSSFITLVNGGWGGNVTGFLLFEYGIAGKWLELLKQIAPAVTRAAVIRDPNASAGIGQWAVIQAMTPSRGVS